MLTPEEKQWCREMAIELRLKNGVPETLYSTALKLGFSISLN